MTNLFTSTMYSDMDHYASSGYGIQFWARYRKKLQQDLETENVFRTLLVSLSAPIPSRGTMRHYQPPVNMSLSAVTWMLIPVQEKNVIQ